MNYYLAGRLSRVLSQRITRWADSVTSSWNTEASVVLDGINCLSRLRAL